MKTLLLIIALFFAMAPALLAQETVVLRGEVMTREQLSARCNTIGGLAEAIMRNRQGGISTAQGLFANLTAGNGPGDEWHTALIAELIRGAYSHRIAWSEEEGDIIALVYGRNMEQSCLAEAR